MFVNVPEVTIDTFGFLRNKDFIVKNLQLLFVNVPEVTIDTFRSLKSWIKEVSHEQYWNQLFACLTDRQASTPPVLSNGRDHGEVLGTIMPPPGSNSCFLPPRREPNVQAGRMFRNILISKTNNNKLPVTLHHDTNDWSLHPLHWQVEAKITYLNG